MIILEQDSNNMYRDKIDNIRNNRRKYSGGGIAQIIRSAIQAASKSKAKNILIPALANYGDDIFRLTAEGINKSHNTTDNPKNSDVIKNMQNYADQYLATHEETDEDRKNLKSDNRSKTGKAIGRGVSMGGSDLMDAFFVDTTPAAKVFKESNNNKAMSLLSGGLRLGFGISNLGNLVEGPVSASIYGLSNAVIPSVLERTTRALPSKLNMYNLSKKVQNGTANIQELKRYYNMLYWENGGDNDFRRQQDEYVRQLPYTGSISSEAQQLINEPYDPYEGVIMRQNARSKTQVPVGGFPITPNSSQDEEERKRIMMIENPRLYAALYGNI